MRLFMINPKHLKAIAIFFIQVMALEIFFPAAAYALTGGPSQPEVESFEPVGTTEMVDLFSGDFVYNIPLMDVEGMPINISYHSGITMDQEASWVGLGWNINPGAITRQMRGLPDDFNGDAITKEHSRKENNTWGATIAGNIEWFGKKLDIKDSIGQVIASHILPNHLKPNLNMNLGVNYNNYTGLGYEVSFNAGLGIGINSTNDQDLTLGLGFNAQSYSGFDLTPAAGIRRRNDNDPKQNYSFGIGMRYNTLEGIQALTTSGSIATSPNWWKKGSWKRTGMVPFGSVTHIPQLMSEYVNRSSNYNLNIGNEFPAAINKGLSFQYYRSRQDIKNKIENPEAFGYMYSQNMATDRKDNFVMDFNRVNDGIYVKSREYMPFVNYTYDIFSISGEGTGGIFRPFRGDVGVLYDADRENRTVGLGLGYGFSPGSVFKGEVDVNGNFGRSTSGKWYKNKDRDHDFKMIEHLKFYASNDKSRRYEPSYFKVTGEKTISDQNYFENIGGRYPMRLGLEYANAHSRGEIEQYFNTKAEQKSLTGPVLREREPRSKLVSSLVEDEARIHALDKTIRLYPNNSFVIDPETNLLEYEDQLERPEGKHLSEFTITNEDGRRYVYGIPAQNVLQRDANFNIVDPEDPTIQKDESKGLVTYNGGTDNSTNNANGVDGFFARNTLGPYAHSFLLTAILSADYVDVTGDGITDDDLGTAIRLNYKRVYEEYEWRTPFSRAGNQGYYEEGYKNDRYDDKANYIYGKKEVWYLHSIESKNYIACFYTSKRLDACGVDNENGGIDTSMAFHKLDSIKLFTRNDLLYNGNEALPIKTVHFEYDYTLCPGIPNHALNSNEDDLMNTYGKLKLKKIFFTYGKSKKGKVSPYQFFYSDFNPRYTAKGYDRWGFYKPMPSNADIADITDENKGLATHDDPYVVQDKETADEYTSAWTLDSIKLPSGGAIKLEYESDDYAYVQDRQAMQMFKVIGAGYGEAYNTIEPGGFLYERNRPFHPDVPKAQQVKNHLFFELTEPIAASEVDDMKKKYFPAIGENLYFKFLLDLAADNDENDDTDYEFVSGYAQVQEVGFSKTDPGSSTYDLGYVKVRKMSFAPDGDYFGDEITHPISKTAHRFMKAYQPLKVHALFSKFEPAPGQTDGGTFKSLVGSLKEAKLMFENFYKEMEDKDVARHFIPNKSMIRLKCPTGKKLGGGSRVKRITINDSWADMVSGGETATYGQDFNYEKIDESDSTRRISSGVASYEPGVGKEENPFTEIFEYRENKAAAPDARFTVEGPIMNEFFPAPSVGYARVTTTNIKPSASIKRTATGYKVNEYYTARDFPVQYDNTNKKSLPNFSKGEGETSGFRKGLRVLSRLLSYPVIDRDFVTQGYSIELNDMHGKPKAEWSYEENNPNYISGVEYKYKCHKFNGKFVPTDTVSVLSAKGVITQQYIGREMDMTIDLRWSKSRNISGAFQNNIDGFWAGLFAAVFRVIPSLKYGESEFGSAVSTKVIYRYGILDEIVVHDQAASVSTKNLLFDELTGEVLLTRTTNEFNDPIFSFNYPAYYAHYGMAPGYLNTGITISHIDFDNGSLTGFVGYTEFIKAGDEMMLSRVLTNNGEILREEPFGARIWAVTDPQDPDELVFMTRSGHLVDPGYPGDNNYYNLKIIRSGHRNMQSVYMGAVTTLQNPIDGDGLTFDKVLNSSAMEFSDHWASAYRKAEREIAMLVPISPTIKTGGPGTYTPVCSLECYQKLIDTLTNPGTLPKNLITLLPGDYIDLTKPPFADLYDCVKNSVAPPCLFFAQSGGRIVYGGEQTFSGLFPHKNSYDKNLVCYNGEGNDELFAKLNAETMGNLSFGDECDPFDGDLCDVVKSYVVGGCTLKICLAQYACPGGDCGLCFDLDPGEATPSEGFDCPDGYVTKRFTTSPYFQKLGSLCEFITQVRTMQSCPEFCAACDTAVIADPVPPSDIDTPALGNCNYRYTSRYVNPYTQGIKGNWRSTGDWVFFNKRSQGTTSTDIRNDGIYLDYADFWLPPVLPGGVYYYKSSMLDDWRKKAAVTLCNRTGNEIENVDALNIYSAALFGYGQSIAKAVGNNMKYRQIAYDGFEDYDYPYDLYEDHFSFKGYTLASTAHTGKKSLSVAANSTATATRPVRYLELLAEPTQGPTDNHYYKKPLEDMTLFSPDPGRYLLNCWIKEPVTCATGYITDTAIVKITKFSVGHPTIADTLYSDTTFKLVARGHVIEGWQRIDSSFYVPDSAHCITVIFKAGSNGCYFDDFRIFPIRGNMKSFVYDPRTLRLVAQLDENNYATFYEYDPEGRLVRIKRETERGIKTIQESRTGLKKTSYTQP